MIPGNWLKYCNFYFKQTSTVWLIMYKTKQLFRNISVHDKCCERRDMYALYILSFFIYSQYNMPPNQIYITNKHKITIRVSMFRPSIVHFLYSYFGPAVCFMAFTCGQCMQHSSQFAKIWTSVHYLLFDYLYYQLPCFETAKSLFELTNTMNAIYEN